ncbi:hypothetical protein [Streptomyces sp. NPDC050528]|uniref:hypothetical protein n=1 Tax=Streptomyces sp. NPDC050528 TaxID=3365623 RepID=UPI0037B3C783
MRAPTEPNVHQLTVEDFTDEDVAEFHRLMGELLTKCTAVGRQHAPEGTWVPSASGLFDQMAESMQLFADISRTLNHTRAGIRRIGGRARLRLYDRTSAGGSGSGSGSGSAGTGTGAGTHKGSTGPA